MYPVTNMLKRLHKHIQQEHGKA